MLPVRQVYSELYSLWTSRFDSSNADAQDNHKKFSAVLLPAVLILIPCTFYVFEAGRFGYPLGVGAGLGIVSFVAGLVLSRVAARVAITAMLSLAFVLPAVFFVGLFAPATTLVAAMLMWLCMSMAPLLLCLWMEHSTRNMSEVSYLLRAWMPPDTDLDKFAAEFYQKVDDSGVISGGPEGNRQVKISGAEPVQGNETRVETVLRAIKKIGDIGGDVTEVEVDLVNTEDIRAMVNDLPEPATVDSWVASPDFPNPYEYSGELPVWEWGDVNRWLTVHNPDHADRLIYLTDTERREIRRTIGGINDDALT